MKYNLDLFSDFSWDTNDPVNKDQFHQHDDRVYGGGGISRTINGSLFNLPTETVVGLQGRDDDINIGLSSTTQRLFLSNTLFDHVNEGNAAIYGENTVHWTNWLRTVVGWRGDYYAASVNSMLQPANWGIPRRPSAARNSAWCWDRSPRPNSLSAPVWAITATMRAGR